MPAPVPRGDTGVGVPVAIGVNIFFVAVGFFVGMDVVDRAIIGDSGIATRAVVTTFFPESTSWMLTRSWRGEGFAGIVPVKVTRSRSFWPGE